MYGLMHMLHVESTYPLQPYLTSLSTHIFLHPHITTSLSHPGQTSLQHPNMKSLLIPSFGAAPEIASNIPIPTPTSSQLLIKSLWTAVNPVDTMIATYGILVTAWPTGLGADAYGIVVRAGEEAQQKYGWSEGDYVVGCTRIGVREFATAQEYHLMDAAVAMRKPKNLNAPEAVAVGSAFQTAALGISQGLGVAVGEETGDGSWVLVLGGAGSVGGAAVQILCQAGYKVIASCSPHQSSRVKELGAVETFDYHLPLQEQYDAVSTAAGGEGKIHRIFDATSSDDPVLAKLLFEASDAPEKKFVTTNDWTPIGSFHGGKTYEIHLGMLGRPEAKEINEAMMELNPVLTGMFEDGRLRPQEVEVIPVGGVEGFVEGMKKRGEGRKIVVRIGEE